MNIMRNLDEYLKQLEKKAGITSSTNATRCDSIAEELLTSFNNNPHNSEVTDYISRSNFFDLIGRERNEMVHSRIIAEILGGRYFEISKKTTLIHFFDIVLMRAKQQGVSLPKEFFDAVLTRSIDIDSLADKQVEYPLSSYLRTYTGNKNSQSDIGNRLDIYLRYNLASALKTHGNKCVELFVENKVLSQEHDNQTQIYYDNCVNGKQALQLFVYLSPISPRDLSSYERVDEKLKPIGVDKQGNRVYIHICYQDILDKIIAPLLQDNRMSNRDRVLLEEYVNCLELPALPDSNNDNKNIGVRELSIMAVSDEEKKLLTQFMGDSDNKRLLDIAVNYKLGHKLYSYGSVECMTFDQALENALSDYIKRNGEFKSMKDFRDIYGAQKGGARFLIFALKETDDKLYYIPTHLFEYNGKAYPSIVNALKVAVKDYISRTGKSTDEVIEDFKVIYERVKWHQHVFKKSGEPIQDMMYLPTDFPNLFIRKQINQDKIIKINEILGDGFAISTISDHCYHQLLMSGDDSLFENYDKHLFRRLPNSYFYYRCNSEDRLERINSILSTQIEYYNLSKEDKHLLDKIYNNNRNLILSILRLQLENELNMENCLEKEYKRLVKLTT